MSAATKNVEIEYLRAVAVIFVIVQHFGTVIYWQPQWLLDFYKYVLTYTGVDIFF